MEDYENEDFEVYSPKVESKSPVLSKVRVVQPVVLTQKVVKRKAMGIGKAA